MDQVTATLVVGVSSLAFGGVVSAVVSHHLNRRKEHIVLMRQKAEALYLAADEFGRVLGSHVISHFPVAAGRMDYNQFLDLQIAKPPSKLAGGAETMTMLVRIYFPEIEPELEELFRVRSSMSTLSAAHREAWRDGDGVGQEWLDAFKSIGLEVDAAVKALQQAIVASAQSYGERRGRRLLKRIRTKPQR